MGRKRKVENAAIQVLNIYSDMTTGATSDAERLVSFLKLSKEDRADCEKAIKIIYDKLESLRKSALIVGAKSDEIDLKKLAANLYDLKKR